MTKAIIEQLVSEAAHKYEDDNQTLLHLRTWVTFFHGSEFSAPLYREEGFMMAVNTLKENDGAAGFATIWADYLLANKDIILGVKK